MGKTLAELAREALAVQDACNLCAVAQGFARAMLDLAEHTSGTDERNCHPIAVVWADKIAHLTHTQYSWDSMTTYGEVHDLAKSDRQPKPGRNARFWTWENGDWVKITLKPGQALGYGYHYGTEEGYASGSVSWEHAGDHVVREYTRNERDCDGLYTGGGVHVAPLDKLAEVGSEIGILRPEWTEDRSNTWQRDHSAEAAGY